jgi:hypothetical protein
MGEHPGMAGHHYPVMNGRRDATFWALYPKSGLISAVAGIFHSRDAARDGLSLYLGIDVEEMFVFAVLV